VSDIDWGKAPEGFDHYSTVYGCFVRKVEYTNAWRASPSGCVIVIDETICNLIKRPAHTWNGTGLPPVGTVCNAVYKGSDQGVVTVIFRTESCVILKNNTHKDEQCGQLHYYNFTPIRTPEQIAADEHARFLAEACKVAGCDVGSTYCNQIIQPLIKAGYRKA
jgi:hypothetical protein